ncbi:MAG: type IV pilus assembly protein PilM [Candidatus Eisenbacteria bacterium]|nr:type IV pilus assembly protein PilM [Candidatus Eisenbacteria bacterium]
MNPTALSRLTPTLRRLAAAGTRPLAVPGRRRALRGEVVGVDLGGSCIRLARVRRAGSRLELLSFAEIPIAPALTDESPLRRPEVAAALREALRRHGMAGRPAVALVSGLDVVLRRTTMPDMSRADLLSALALEAHKYVPFAAERIALDVERLGPAAEPGQSDLLVAACDRVRVADARALLTKAGLKVLAITTPPLAFRNVMRHTRLAEGNDVTALFDVGRQTTNLCIFKHDELRFSRELSMGSQAFTEALRTIIVPGQPTVKLTDEEAERLKQEHGIPMGEDEKKVAGGIPLAHVAIMLRPTLERLVREIWGSFDYCNEEFLGESVQRVFLTGRGARLRNFAPYLESVLKVPVTVLDLGADVLASGAPSGVEPGALGFAPVLALEDLSGLNLVHALEGPEPAEGEKVAALFTLPRIATAAVLALAVDGSMVLMQHAEATGRVRSLTQARAAAQTQEPGLQALEGRMQTLRTHQALLASLSGGRPDWALLLKDLSLRIGPTLRLSEVRPEEQKPDPSAPAGTTARPRVVMEGTLMPSAMRPEEDIATTLRALMASPFFQDVRLVECTPATDGRSHVVIACGLKGAP